MNDGRQNRMIWAGSLLALGAGIGMTVGVLVSGGAGIALGSGFGAAFGLVVGAAIDSYQRRGN